MPNPHSGNLFQQGFVAVENNNVTYPAIAVNGSGRGIMAFTLVGVDHYPSLHQYGRRFGFVRERLQDSYSDTGRNSIDPELLLRILLIGYLYGVTAERKLVLPAEIAQQSGDPSITIAPGLIGQLNAPNR